MHSLQFGKVMGICLLPGHQPIDLDDVLVCEDDAALIKVHKAGGRELLFADPLLISIHPGHSFIIEVFSELFEDLTVKRSQETQ